jgi:proline iminopeptidase
MMIGKRFFTWSVVCLSGLLGCAASNRTLAAPAGVAAPPVAQAGPGGGPASDLKLVNTLLDMMAAHNRHDVEQELGFFSDDAQFEVVGAWVKEGKEELRKPLTLDVLLNSRLTLTDFRVQGHTVTFHAKEQNDIFTSLGMDAIDQNCQATFRGGRIQEVRVTTSPLSLEAMDKQFRVFLEWLGRNRPEQLEFAKHAILDDDVPLADLSKAVELLGQWRQALKNEAAQEAARPQAPSLAPGEFTAELNGLKLWFKVSGTGPVCLMPTAAWGPSSDMCFRTLRPLEKTFTVVYLDTRGTGRSQRAATTKEYTWEHLVADLDALRAHLGQEKVWLMGHSEGGMYVLHYACTHPQRVNGLILLDTAAVWDEQADKDIMSRMQRRRDQPWFAEAMKAIQQGVFSERGFFSGETVKSDEDLIAQVKASTPLYWSDPANIAPHAADFEAGSMSATAFRGSIDSHRLPFDLREPLQRVTAPALIVVGDDDFICSPFAAKRLHLCLPNSKLLVIEKAGHFPWLEQPEAFFSDVPAFLEALRSAPRP